MSRLIADAAKLDKSIDANDMSFGNIVKSINAVQKEMGIYGTTALEAEKTISGSLSSMKAAWGNLITGIADDNADFDTLIGNMVETVGTFAENILPRIEVALDGAVKLIEGLFPKIIEALPNLINTLLPSIVNGALNIVQSFVTAISENGDLLVQSAIDAVMTLANGILSMLPDIIKLGLDLIVSLALGIANSLPTLIPTIIDVVLKIVEILTSPEMITNLINAGIQLILGLVDGLITAIPKIIEALPTIIENLITGLLDAIPLLIEAGIQLIVSLVSNIPAIIMGIVKAIPKIIMGLIDAIIKFVPKIAETGLNLIKGLWNGIKDAGKWLWDKISGFFGGIVDGIKDFFGIHSPSRLFRDEIGKMMAKGIGVGFEDEFDDVKDDIENSLDFGEADYGITTSSTSIGDFSGGSSAYRSSASQNVNVTVGIDDSANAMGLARALLPFLKIAEKEVYA